MGLFFFFFKQKTAYEMRISDWSSDVCSSDLRDRRVEFVRHTTADVVGLECRQARYRSLHRARCALAFRHRRTAVGMSLHRGAHAIALPGASRERSDRSEQHTYEPPSLTRSAYDVFSLQKKAGISRTISGASIYTPEIVCRLSIRPN